mmetsp:Transcript_100348/g.306698  ORF Transcript_100348/g.306698 Transcript_100348/m.306698 type:complete len:595 (-) Transcript_100348:645-2429(-)
MAMPVRSHVLLATNEEECRHLCSESQGIFDCQEARASAAPRSGWARARLAILALGVAAVAAGVATRRFGARGARFARAPGNGRGAVGLRGEVMQAAAGTVGVDNCNTTHQCAGAGMQCYEQVPLVFAQCRGACVPGRDPTHWDGQHWTCKELGPRTPGADVCVSEGVSCLKSKCCRDPGHTCFEKNTGWAACKASCQPGPNFGDPDGEPWTCNRLGPTRPSTAAWVAGECAAGPGMDCLKVGCCKNPGERCWKKNDLYGACHSTCPAGWSCGTVGSQTPPSEPTRKIKPLPDWAWEQCSGVGQGCLASRCCIGMDVQCYEKNAWWAECKSSCAPGPHADDKQAAWTCTPLGPRSYGVSRKGFPSLYCYSVMRTTGYEVGLMQAQFDKGVGIFGCDDYSLLTADGNVTIGTVQSIQFPGAPVGESVDHTAGNTELFVHAWDALIAAGVWRNHTFTLKVDPDAVMLPDRVRTHLASHVGKKVFIVNCPFGDMIFGALEVFSYHAILEWAKHGHDCPAPKDFGEDKYMTQCMDHLGVARVHDVPILADALCLGSKNCEDGVAGAYHPFKDVDAYFGCWARATGQAPPPPMVPLHVLQ